MSEEDRYATREELFGKPTDRRFKDVIVDGKKFRLRSLTAGELNPWAAKSQTEDGAATAGPRLIVLMAVNSDGQRIFGDTDVKQWLGLDAAFVSELARHCQEHSGQLDEAEIEGIEKN
jgi:hypothetical protein